MHGGSDICPGCGAHVYPRDETHCPHCGRSLRHRTLIMMAVGLAGVAMALLAGLVVWWLLAPSGEMVAGSSPAPSATDAVAAIAVSQSEGKADAAPPVTPAPASGQALPYGVGNAGALPLVPDVIFGEQPQGAIALRGGTLPADADAAPARPDPEEQAALAKSAADAPEIASDPDERRAFAKRTQTNFGQNGLDMVVLTSGEEDKILNMKFSFPAKTAVELIVSGPFPRQCRKRGFERVVFSDPSGASWVYDVENDQLSQK